MSSKTTCNSTLASAILTKRKKAIAKDRPTEMSKFNKYSILKITKIKISRGTPTGLQTNLIKMTIK